MQQFVTALTGEGGISSASLWSDVTIAVPLIVMIFGFAFGYHVVKKVLKRGSKGNFSM